MASTAQASRRSILVVGYGRNDDTDEHGFSATHEKIKALVEADAERASKLGFDSKVLYLSPDDTVDAVENVRQVLQSQHWDALSIGLGLRGRKEYTKVFEDVVNAAVEIKGTSGMKFLFASEPDGIVDALRRHFDGLGEVKEV